MTWAVLTAARENACLAVGQAGGQGLVTRQVAQAVSPMLVIVHHVAGQVLEEQKLGGVLALTGARGKVKNMTHAPGVKVAQQL